MKTKVIVILGMVVTLASAYGLDYWVEFTRRIASQTFNQILWQTLYWGSGLGNLLLASMLLALVWFMYFYVERNKFLAFLFIAIGLIPTFSLGVWTTGVVWFFNPIPFLSFTSHFSIAGAFITALGISCLIPSRR